MIVLLRQLGIDVVTFFKNMKNLTIAVFMRMLIQSSVQISTLLNEEIKTYVQAYTTVVLKLIEL